MLQNSDILKPRIGSVSWARAQAAPRGPTAGELCQQQGALIHQVVRYGAQRASFPRGLTLMETLLALLMLSLMIVGLLGLLGSLLVNSTKAGDASAGLYAAQYLLEEAAIEGPPDVNGGVREGKKPLRTHELELPLDFQYRLEWTRIGQTRFYTPPGGGSREVLFGTRLYHVRVTVWWMVNQPDQGRGEGGGRRSVVMERVVKVGKT